MPDQGQSGNKDLPGFWPKDYGVLWQRMSVYVGRAAGNTSDVEAGRGCQDPGFAKLDDSVLVARGEAIFCVQRQDCSGVSVSGWNSPPFPTTRIELVDQFLGGR
jgi:hypothetical protein